MYLQQYKIHTAGGMGRIGRGEPVPPRSCKQFWFNGVLHLTELDHNINLFNHKRLSVLLECFDLFEEMPFATVLI